MKIPLCNISQLNRCLGVELELEGEGLSLLLIKDQEQIMAYKNRCPHTGIELNWLPDQFLDLEGKHIQCATHGARFRLNDGLCISGPCTGQSLDSVPLFTDADRVYLHYPDNN
ncbi:MAG: Rieske (2Fe-2S) protein [Gammaproteobacteria bacterium]|nr:Rieske (2Fe-2S) protein [Gammaproteobacteria bacterium]